MEQNHRTQTKQKRYQTNKIKPLLLENNTLRKAKRSKTMNTEDGSKTSEIKIQNTESKVYKLDIFSNEIRGSDFQKSKSNLKDSFKEKYNTLNFKKKDGSSLTEQGKYELLFTNSSCSIKSKINNRKGSVKTETKNTNFLKELNELNIKKNLNRKKSTEHLKNLYDIRKQINELIDTFEISHSRKLNKNNSDFFTIKQRKEEYYNLSNIGLEKENALSSKMPQSFRKNSDYKKRNNLNKSSSLIFTTLEKLNNNKKQIIRSVTCPNEEEELMLNSCKKYDPIDFNNLKRKLHTSSSTLGISNNYTYLNKLSNSVLLKTKLLTNPNSCRFIIWNPKPNLCYNDIKVQFSRNRSAVNLHTLKEYKYFKSKKEKKANSTEKNINYIEKFSNTSFIDLLKKPTLRNISKIKQKDLDELDFTKRKKINEKDFVLFNNGFCDYCFYSAKKDYSRNKKVDDHDYYLRKIRYDLLDLKYTSKF